MLQSSSVITDNKGRTHILISIRMLLQIFVFVQNLNEKMRALLKYVCSDKKLKLKIIVTVIVYAANEFSKSHKGLKYINL